MLASIHPLGERARGTNWALTVSAYVAGSTLASDGFFPFPDGPLAAVEAGVRAIVQPGGSKRDAEVLEAVRAAGGAMVFTRRRHFRH